MTTPHPPSLTDRITEAIRPNMLLGLQDAELDGPGGTKRIGEWADWIAAAVAAVVQAELDELLAELDGRDEKARKRWIRKQEKQLGIRFADFRAGRWEMDLAMGRDMAAAYVAMAKAMLGDAPNYTETKLEFDVKVAESPEVYTLVVQRHALGALTPHEARQRAEAELATARAENARLRHQIAGARNAALTEAAAHLDRIADATEAEVAKHYGPASGIGPGSADMVREAAKTVRALATQSAT